MKIKHLVFFMFLFFLPVVSLAEEPVIILKDLVQEALNNNPEILMANK